MASLSEPRTWSRLPDAELLQLRFCDLGLSLPGTPLQRRLQRVYGELERRGIRFRPHMWLAEEWFSPDGIPRHRRAVLSGASAADAPGAPHDCGMWKAATPTG